MSEVVDQLIQPLPPAILDVPKEGVRHHLVSHRDWKNLRAKIDRLRTHQRQYAAVAWTAVGCAVSALLSAFAWYPTYGSLDEAAQLQFAWIGPAMIGGVVIGGVAAALMFWVAHANQSDLKIAVDQLLVEMDEMPLVASQAAAA